jgi:hypothetical protein
MDVIIALCFLGSAVWVLFDAKKIGVEKGQIDGLGDLSPSEWFFACLLLWIVAFPLYLSKRGELLRIQSGVSTGGQLAQSQNIVVNVQGASNNASIDVVDQLQKLNDLRTQGVLSDQEFAEQKTKLLSASK